MPLLNVKMEMIQEDIDAGIAWDCQKCPASRALHRAIREKLPDGTLLVYIGEGKAIVEHERNVSSVDLPPAVKEFIDHFDRGLPVKPISAEFLFEEGLQLLK